MWMIPSSVKIYFSTEPTDMRKSFNGLCGEVVRVIHRNPSSGHLFVFFNRLRDRVKILWWDRSGFALWYKRLEAGKFQLPQPKNGSLELSQTELAMILEGIDLEKSKRRRRFKICEKT